MPRMPQDKIEARLKTLPDWSLANEALQRTFAFEDFAGAMRFVDRIAGLAEKANHHPDILIRFKKVTLSLTTHDAGGVSIKDFEFAAKADREAVSMAPVAGRA